MSVKSNQAKNLVCLDNSFQNTFRDLESKFDFQFLLEQVGGRRVRTSDAKLGSSYNIQTFCSNETATSGLKKGNNRRGTWRCPENQIKTLLGKMEKLSQKGFVPDRTIGWKQPHQIKKREDKTSPLWFDFDVKDTNRIEHKKTMFPNNYVPVKYFIDKEEYLYKELGIKFAELIQTFILEKFPNTQTLHYYIYYDEMKFDNGFWIYFNKNFYIQDKKQIVEKFHKWCKKHLVIEGLKKQNSFYEDHAPQKNPFVCPLIPKQDRAFKLIFESDDPDFAKIRSKTWGIYDGKKSKKDCKLAVFVYNKKKEKLLFHHQNNLEILGNAYPPEMEGITKKVGKVSKIVNAEFLHRLNRLRKQYPELNDVLSSAESQVSESTYQGKSVWNIKIEPNTCVCPIHKTTHHRAVGYVNIYKGSIQNATTFYCLHSGTGKTYLDKELQYDLGKPKQSKTIATSKLARQEKWIELFADYNDSGYELDIYELGLLVKQFYPDIKYVEENTAGKDCFYMWDKNTGIWEELADKKNKKINTLIRKWWKDYAKLDLKFLAEIVHLDDNDHTQKEFIKFKKAVKQQLGSTTKITALLDSFSIESDKGTEKQFSLLLNSKRYLLPFQNGTIDWGYKDTRGVYHAPDKPFRVIEKDDYVSMFIPKTYCGKYNPPKKFPFSVGKDLFQTKKEYDTEYEYLYGKLDGLFNRSILDPEQRDYTKDQIGYAQTGYTHFKTFMGLIGHKANNGKSTLCGVIKSQIYPFCDCIDEKFLTDPQIHPQYLDALRRGCRLGYFEEVADGKVIIAQRMKEWVGLLNETAQIRVLYKVGGQVVFVFQCKFWVCSNFHLPLDKNDNGLNDRMRVAEFTTRFVKQEEWDEKLEKMKHKPDPVKYWNDKQYYLEDNRFKQIFKESELMASVFQDYFYARSVKAVQIKDLKEPKAMRDLRKQITEKVDQIAMFIHDSLAQGVLDNNNMSKGDWISQGQFFQYYRKWLSKTQSGMKDWGERIQVQKFNKYIKNYIQGEELYPDVLHNRNGSKKCIVNGKEICMRNIVYGLKWIHKKIHQDLPEHGGGFRGGWDKKKSYKEKEEERKRRRWEAERDDRDYDSDDYGTDIEEIMDDDEPVVVVKKSCGKKAEVKLTNKKFNPKKLKYEDENVKLCIKKKKKQEPPKTKTKKLTQMGICNICNEPCIDGNGQSISYDPLNKKWYCEEHHDEWMRVMSNPAEFDDYVYNEAEWESASEDEISVHTDSDEE